MTRLLPLLALLCLPSLAIQGQTSLDAFHKALREHATFTNEDLSVLQQGQIIARLLPVKDKREVAVCGVVSLKVPPDVFLQFTRDNVAQQNNRAILQIGKFSNPPVIEDLQGLTLDKRDIEDLKQCAVNDCDLKMSAAMIERMRKEVDWNNPEYPVQATLVFRQMLLDYLREYQARGSDALMKYSDKEDGVHLAEEQRSLLESAVYFHQFAPEFTGYLRNYPSGDLPGVENYAFWSKLKFGLKPVVTITHVILYSRREPAAPQVIVASRQIYANHYFDSSLAISAYVGLPNTAGPQDSYLLYTNRSRADALGGLFSKLKRSVVENEAMSSLQSILQEQKLKLEAGPGAPATQADSQRGETSILYNQTLRRLALVLVIVSVILVLLFIVRRNLTQHSST